MDILFILLNKYFICFLLLLFEDGVNHSKLKWWFSKLNDLGHDNVQALR